MEESLIISCQKTSGEDYPQTNQEAPAALSLPFWKDRNGGSEIGGTQNGWVIEVKPYQNG